MLLERRGASRECAAGAREVAKRVEHAGGLRKNLRPGVEIVRAEIAGVAKLIRAKRAPALRKNLRSLLHQREIVSRNLSGLRTGTLVDQHYFGAQRAHHACPLGRVALGHDSYKRITLHRADDRETSRRYCR